MTVPYPVLDSGIAWRRAGRHEHFGNGWRNYKAVLWADGWVLSQTRDASWHMQPGAYRTLREAKAAAAVMDETAEIDWARTHA